MILSVPITNRASNSSSLILTYKHRAPKTSDAADAAAEPAEPAEPARPLAVVQLRNKKPPPVRYIVHCTAST